MTFSAARRRARDPARPRCGGDELALAYAEHSRSLLRLAVLLVPDVTAAREMVYESFAALHSEHRYQEQRHQEHSFRCRQDALAFLLRDIVRRARAAARDGGFNPDAPGAARGDAAVIGAVRALPRVQREALVLRYYGQLSEEQAAAAMGVRTRVLRASVARGMSELRAVIGPPVPAREKPRTWPMNSDPQVTARG
jgi:DNA-directed RNA polymerase specialized sigma24 family protein